MPSLLTRIRAAAAGATARTPAAEFCDSRAQVCDSACRAAAHRVRAEQSLLLAAFRI
ncbi:hypothetical protein [Streptomyces sp. Ru87]|uniref:hypothetical protein n=1 Tax=Streptomyces sp. Ru87 TaxID=2044307 RepID=UPI0015D50D73|nr:hypothetical protein [Streptomyces sp. Ru87]